MRKCKAIITINTGPQGSRQITTQRVVSYTMMQSIDNDADQFSIDVGNSDGALNLCKHRDNEVEVQLFLSDFANRWVPIFRGLADSVEVSGDHVMSIAGRDLVSSLAMDSDALFGKWPSVKPRLYIETRASRLGIKRMRVAHMSQMNNLVSDGSETEWAMWYRMARKKGLYMWTDNLGGLVIDKLAYSTTPVYRFGHGKGYTPVEFDGFADRTGKDTRKRKVWIYGDNAKKGRPMVAKATDPHIASWRKKSLLITTNTTAKNQQDLIDAADEEIFETIVGAREIELTIQDKGILIQQNTMAHINLPEYDLVGNWFIVGVQREGSSDTGMRQVVRLREKTFALTERVPDAPQLTPDSARLKPAGNIAALLSQNPNIRWSDSFVKATNEFGVKAGWDFAVFLGVLLSMCMQESGFQNVRQNDHDEWERFSTWAVAQGPGADSPQRQEALRTQYAKKFANDPTSAFNPLRPHAAGVGPMQLTDARYKDWADGYGWFGIAKKGELDGGRWNPDSNIRAAARCLVEKLNVAPAARSSNADDIWIGVARYNGSDIYADQVRATYNRLYKSAISNAVASVKTVREGSTDTNIAIPGHGTLQLPANTPDLVRKAISFCLNHIGDPYKWGGSGPNYDCSSFVSKAYNVAGTPLSIINGPHSGQHGDDTYTLFRKGRFPSVPKDRLLPGDLLFFHHSGGTTPEHVGMYLEDGLFIHDPSTGDTVKVSPLNTDYYVEMYLGARRIADWGSVHDR
jgi:cell wall-associated NlpC family hydrolase/prophage tail gpP-like protein